MDAFDLLIYALAAIGFVTVLTISFLALGFIVLMRVSSGMPRVPPPVELTPKQGS